MKTLLQGVEPMKNMIYTDWVEFSGLYDVK